MKKDKHIGLHLSKELHYKLHFISRYEGNSAHGHTLSLLRNSLKHYKHPPTPPEKKEKHFSIYFDEETLLKFQSYSRSQCRSANAQITHTLREAVMAFEAEHGEIEVLDNLDLI